MFQLARIDPVVLVIVSMSVVLVSIAASAVSAWRTGRTNAVEALTGE